MSILYHIIYNRQARHVGFACRLSYIIARRLGGKRMSASGIVENMVRHHLITYGDELKEWYKL
ncbi:MAG: DUF3408 domain-containing protein [Prevotella sp.]|nr:DUF3408 domain-containing protein [Prevotella sp.]